MGKQCYKAKNFTSGSLDLIHHATVIIEEYALQGFDLTLCQLYYQFVSRDLLDNKQSEYKRLGSVINNARLAGLIDWTAIVDRTRNLRGLSHWESPEGIISAVAHQYRTDKWASQPNSVEVWIEKDALVGVIQDVCQDNDVPYFSCRGYTSQSEMWRAARRRIDDRKMDNKPVGLDFIIHLGDHDPSGIDMTRDIEDRMKLFESNMSVSVIRIALNMDQVEEFRPPPNPAKLTDSRASGYITAYGNESWELDALNPPYISKIIQEHIDNIRDDAIWAVELAKEDEQRLDLIHARDRWDEVVAFLNGDNR